jgi:hypothetical protein
MALTVRTILRVSDVPTSLTPRSSMVALPEQVERIGKCGVFQAAIRLATSSHSPFCDLGLAAHRTRPHFRHVIISTLRAGLHSCRIWIGGSGHVDRYSDHGFAQRPGASGRLRRQIK